MPTDQHFGEIVFDKRHYVTSCKREIYALLDTIFQSRSGYETWRPCTIARQIGCAVCCHCVLGAIGGSGYHFFWN